VGVEMPDVLIAVRLPPAWRDERQRAIGLSDDVGREQNGARPSRHQGTERAHILGRFVRPRVGHQERSVTVGVTPLLLPWRSQVVCVAEHRPDLSIGHPPFSGTVSVPGRFRKGGVTSRRGRASSRGCSLAPRIRTGRLISLRMRDRSRCALLLAVGVIRYASARASPNPTVEKLRGCLLPH
jgi:hypothetical protein